MKSVLAVVLLCFITLNPIETGHGARILGFFPFAVKSHHRVFEPLLRGLALRGHNVTYFTPFKMVNPPPNVHHIIIKNFLPEMMQVMASLPGPLQHWIPTAMGTFAVTMAEKVMQQKEFKDLIDSTSEFDLIVSEITIIHEPFSPLCHRFNAHSVEVMPSGNIHYSWSIFGNPYDTSYIIDTSVVYTDRMSLFEKMHNTFNSVMHRLVIQLYYMPQYQRIADKYFRYPGWENRPPLDELIRNASIVLVNSHHSLTYPYPQAANIKDIGGINLQLEPNQIPKDLQDFMDGAKDGFIYFTLGSHAQVSSTLGDNIKKAFTEVFSKLKQRVLWKWETDFPNLPSNIRISKWFPQQEILAHKNVRLFITHGGFLSLTEAVYNGVPLIGIPLMGDQYKNAKHMEHFGYGLPLYLENITAQSLSWTINRILSDTSFAENARKRSAMYRDKPETALETAIYWTEYVIRHEGAHHLRPAIATMPWYQQAMLDVYGFMIAMTILPLYLSYFIMKLVCRCFCGSSEVKKKKKKD